ncbi:thiol-disulfide oxidoreductase DCC family protein [Lutimaribacter marinistellae]|uniref:Thiol-disulfide oxidoreductase DCC family protein n=1 Tax=Lutimaribacter marinistellae TaxID=1820329 RepID=A0ABV7TGH8_9RHOB
MTETTKTRVLYNAECPICNFEIGHYRNHAEASDLPIRFDDLNTADLTHWGLSRDDAAKRLYVVKNGEMRGGIDGFLLLWAEMPRYRWLGRVVGLPGVKQVASLTYDFVLAPAIYRWHRLRKQRLSANGSTRRH